MKMRDRTSLAGVLASLVCVIAPGVAWAQATYRLTDLGTLGGTWSEPWAMNEAGQVTGRSSTPGDSEIHPFLWDGTSMQDLGTLGGTINIATAINAAGQVTGYSYTANDAAAHAFMWDGTRLRDINPPGAQTSIGRDINDSGHVAGSSDIGGFMFDGTSVHHPGLSGAHAINNSGQLAGSVSVCCAPQLPPVPEQHAALWDGNTVLDLTLQSSSPELWETGWASQINDSGWVTGLHSTYELDQNGLPSGWGEHFLFLWDGAAMHLGTLDGRACYSHAINAVGLVTGQCHVTRDFESHAVLFDGTTMQDLGTLGGTYAWGSDIDTEGWVVGDSYTAGDVDYHPFLWDGLAMHDLNDLVSSADPLKPYVSLIGAQGTFINERGQIAANGIDSRTSEAHAYLLSPIRTFNFTGFFTPVDNIPIRNLVNAGRAIPVKFSLGGYQGLDIFEAGYPISKRIDCVTSAPLDAIEETVTAGSSELSYASGADQYHYVWKTNSDWAKTCRQLIVRLNDLTEHVANFQFK